MTIVSHNPKIWTVYADGACAPTNPGPSAWGAVVLPPGKGPEEHKGFIGHGTNQRAELSAAIYGLEQVPNHAAVELVSDSMYVLNGLTIWRAGWEQRGFKNAKKEPVANKELWQQLYLIADARRVQTRWVRGHTGDLFNERADGLATSALRENKAGLKSSAAIPVILPVLPSAPPAFAETVPLSTSLNNALSALSFAWAATQRGPNPLCYPEGSHQGVLLRVFSQVSPTAAPQCCVQWRDIQIEMRYDWPHEGQVSRPMSQADIRLFLAECLTEVMAPPDSLLPLLETH